ncbi:MAG: squalene/phytoene synthase family protein [Sphingomonas sp.]|uniref:squalene/phytoene synthase family protein n=1 Tax=Sphingomonas sp. TaxID=28214 RepID=UPI001AC66BAD|nr:squalene/phytoene synthase family protein [Sphingomonas sp.]MBN8807362.1 squalene/phytoene synthase family protein [Sphingomonas sp.]
MSGDPLRKLAIGYAPPEARAGLAALLALDDALGQVLRTTREPMVGQMRLAWWREALARLDETAVPGEPVLSALAAAVIPRGVSGERLATMVDGWEVLLAEPGEVGFERHAVARGAGLFAAAARLLGVEGFDVVEAGKGWALADLAGNLSDRALAAVARTLAAPLLTKATRRRWPRRARALGAMVHAARLGLAGPLRPTSVLRLGWHRLTGG